MLSISPKLAEMIIQQKTAYFVQTIRNDYTTKDLRDIKKNQRKLNTLMNDIFTSFVYIALI